jgi:pimeloyl-ACP methyl ester carboxylesterase
MNAKGAGSDMGGMGHRRSSSGAFANGVPWNRFGNGPLQVVLIQGLTFEHRPLTRSEMLFQLRTFRFLEHHYTAWVVSRRPGLPAGTSLADMAADVAQVIGGDLGGGPLDVIGTSTGGSIALHLAADHPDVVRHLVIHSSAHSLSAEARALQLRVARLAEQGRWTDASALLVETVLPRNALGRLAKAPLAWLMARTAPKDPGDLVVSVEAEDAHAFRGRLGEISAPTLVTAGDADPFYTPELFRQTAEGIPGARLALYPGMGHPAKGRRFGEDVLAFLREPLEQRPNDDHDRTRGGG